MRRTAWKRAAAGAALAGLALAAWYGWPRSPAPWTDADIALLKTLSLSSLPPLPADPSNAVADDPRAREFGHALFFDKRLSANGQVACATCHRPELRFTDGLPRGIGIGLSGRNTRSIVGTAYSPWLYWDGRRDSQWSQALTPLEDPAEHGGNRMAYARFIASDPAYRRDYEQLFGPLPDLSDTRRFPEAATPVAGPDLAAAWDGMTPADRRTVSTIFANIGKSIAAYERPIVPGRSRFDDYVDAVVAGDDTAAKSLLDDEEVLGLQLFIGKARCTECHNGPLFTNHEFHNTGILSMPGELPDRGRIDGLRKLRKDPFNCLGPFSDDPQHRCEELEFVRDGITLIGATRTPSLRNLGKTAPYQRKGQFASLSDVLAAYNRAELAMIGHNEALPLGLSRRELQSLEAFLGTLDAPIAVDERWLAPPGEGG